MKYLSFGGGVNSVALYTLLMQQGMEPGRDFEACFIDPGAEDPRTYEYIEWMQRNNYPTTIIPGRVDGLSIYEWYWEHEVFPFRQTRMCTDRFKIRPFAAYLEHVTQPYCKLLGIDYGERTRTWTIRPSGKEVLEYPLVDQQIDRSGCIEIIRATGWPVPVKSGCYICAFQTWANWERLSVEFPDLFERAAQLEDRANDRYVRNGKPPAFFRDAPLRIGVQGLEARRRWKDAQRKCAERKAGQLDMFLDADVSLEECPYCRL